MLTLVQALLPRARFASQFAVQNGAAAEDGLECFTPVRITIGRTSPACEPSDERKDGSFFLLGVYIVFVCMASC